MKRLEKEIEVSVFATDILRSSESTNIKVNFGVSLNLTEKEFKIFKDSSSRGKIKIVCEVEEPILDKVEREYLKAIIKPFKNKVTYITKTDTEEGEYVAITLKTNEYIVLPYFKKGKMYKGLKLDREYSLKELGL